LTGKGYHETDRISIHTAGRDIPPGFRVSLPGWQNKKNTGCNMPERRTTMIKFEEQMKKQSDAIKAIFLDWLRDNGYVVTESEVEREYDAELDEYPVVIGSLEYSGSHVLQNIDPIAYRCGFLDYVDSMSLDQLCDYGMDSDDYVEDIDSLWDDFEEMLVTCDICGDLCLASDAVSISSEDDGHSERACPNCRKN
jgi:hypothetical protein